MREDSSAQTGEFQVGGIMKLAVLGPGGVGGLLAGVLDRAGTEVVVVARPSTAATINGDGLSIASVTFGEFVSRPRAVSELEEPVDGLIVATKAAGLSDALGRIVGDPPVVLPLLNGLDHLAVLRDRFAPQSVLAGTIRVEADRPEPGVVVHTSPFLLVEMACLAPAVAQAGRATAAVGAPAAEAPPGRSHSPGGAGMQMFAEALSDASVPVRVGWPLSTRSEAEVMWSKLVRLNGLACTTTPMTCCWARSARARSCVATSWARSPRGAKSAAPKAPRTSRRLGR